MSVIPAPKPAPTSELKNTIGKMIDETRAVIDRLQRELQSERQARSEEQGLHKQKLFELKEDAENAKFGG